MIECVDYYCLLYLCTQNALWALWLCGGLWLLKSHRSMCEGCREASSWFAPTVIVTVRFLYTLQEEVCIPWAEHLLEDGHEDLFRKQAGGMSLQAGWQKETDTDELPYNGAVVLKNLWLTNAWLEREGGLHYFWGDGRGGVAQTLVCLLNKILLRQLSSMISGVPAGSKISIKALRVLYSRYRGNIKLSS